jgi:hypothetical protein
MTLIVASGRRDAECVALSLAKWIGVPPRGAFLLTRRPHGRLPNDALRILGFVLTNRCRDAEEHRRHPLADVLSDVVKLVNDASARFILNSQPTA